MVCDPSQNNINVGSAGPPPSLPGLIPPFSVPKIPFPDLAIPEGIPEDIIDLIERLFALFPSGIKFVPNADALMKEVWDALASLFNQLAPFLAFYKFIQALLNIILCIIDVLCALINPWATVRAVKRLFKRCIPDFLSLFPWIALLIMILALILLLIALIEYLIAMILDYINQIIRNIKILLAAAQRYDEESVLAAVNKIAYLMCLIEQLFALLLAIAALIAIIRPLMSIGGRSVCSRSRTSDGESDSCCIEDFCPDFIANGPMTSSTGRLIYHSQIVANIPSDPSFDFLRNIPLQPQREERWQFIDTNPGDDKFLDIITPSPEYGFTYWPESEEYNSNSNTVRVPYLLDINFYMNPKNYGNPSDTQGTRWFGVTDIIVKSEPTTYPISWNNGTEQTNPISGCLNLVGGLAWVHNGTEFEPYYINGERATLETLLTVDDSSKTEIPTNDDTVNFLNVNYVFRYNYEVLADKKLTTVMCQPDLDAESAVLNAEFADHRDILAKVGDLPNIGTLDADRRDGTGTLGELARALTKFREDLNEDSANVFAQEATASLNSLRNDSVDFYKRGVTAAADRFVSDFSIDPSLQFVEVPIVVTVQLKDKTGTVLGTNVSAEIGAEIASTIIATPTLGTVTSFEYDGVDSFTASLESKVAGTGEITASVSGEVISEVINRDNDDAQSEIIDKTLTYEFIDRTSSIYGSDRVDRGAEHKDRFDHTDISKDN